MRTQKVFVQGVSFLVWADKDADDLGACKVEQVGHTVRRKRSLR